MANPPDKCCIESPAHVRPTTELVPIPVSPDSLREGRASYNSRVDTHSNCRFLLSKNLQEYLLKGSRVIKQIKQAVLTV
ncbi:unnamed protein product [Allacma fusca]|uniref:Uncharacterized protein n=1 Tax=Allacma fusca TaxID=39272 RepID=A0A8J2LJ10_9HEXA|nr:unnamed protein product [Allacma fusca]